MVLRTLQQTVELMGAFWLFIFIGILLLLHQGWRASSAPFSLYGYINVLFSYWKSEAYLPWVQTGSSDKGVDLTSWRKKCQLVKLWECRRLPRLTINTNCAVTAPTHFVISIWYTCLWPSSSFVMKVTRWSYNKKWNERKIQFRHLS